MYVYVWCMSLHVFVCVCVLCKHVTHKSLAKQCSAYISVGFSHLFLVWQLSYFTQPGGLVPDETGQCCVPCLLLHSLCLQLHPVVFDSHVVLLCQERSTV